jgi:hypothetical protein
MIKFSVFRVPGAHKPLPLDSFTFSRDWEYHLRRAAGDDEGGGGVRGGG